ncbi:lipase family protein [Nocardia sp. NPDC050710]|uniref:lipase family protein n=1 Tax=Nocardia sp. NPDC050710 TaxID=3157220 RepID=UPI0033CB8DA6
MKGMWSFRALVVTMAIGCLLPMGWSPAGAEPVSDGNGTTSPSELQQWIDTNVPPPTIPPAASPPSRNLTPELAALWQAVRSTPSGDPIFDVWPSDLGRFAPGQIVEWRDVTATSAPLVVVPIQRAMLLKFRTTDALGAPSFGTATLVIPAAEWTGPGGRPVLVNALPINSLGLSCTPSYAMAHGLHSKFNAGDLFPPTTWSSVSRGFAVLIPDHEGPWMSYAEPNVAGHVVLDSIRAVRNSSNEFTGSRFAVGGYSGGAIASYAAAMLVAEYAPELNGVLVGASMGGLAADYRTVARQFNGSSASGILLVVSLAMGREYPEILTYMNNLAQWVATSSVKDSCGETNGPLGVVGIPIEVAATVADPLGTDLAERIFRRTDLTNRRSAVPLYIYHGVHDFWIPLEGAIDIYRAQCARGVPVTFRTLGGEHIIALFSGFPGSIDWLDQRLRGVPAPNDCVTNPVRPPN